MITMILEVEEGCSIFDIEEIIRKFNVDYEYDGECVSGNFQESGCRFVFRYLENPESITAEGSPFKWLVSVIGSFNSRANNLFESQRDIYNFVKFFHENSEFKFILSFQYEDIYVFSDNNEMKILKRMVD